jgi:hypothetical protein
MTEDGGQKTENVSRGKVVFVGVVGCAVDGMFTGGNGGKGKTESLKEEGLYRRQQRERNGDGNSRRRGF